jgi:hypothetical protein
MGMGKKKGAAQLSGQGKNSKSMADLRITHEKELIPLREKCHVGNIAVIAESIPAEFLACSDLGDCRFRETCSHEHKEKEKLPAAVLGNSGWVIADKKHPFKYGSPAGKKWSKKKPPHSLTVRVGKRSEFTDEKIAEIIKMLKADSDVSDCLKRELTFAARMYHRKHEIKKNAPTAKQTQEELEQLQEAANTLNAILRTLDDDTVTTMRHPLDLLEKAENITLYIRIRTEEALQELAVPKGSPTQQVRYLFFKLIEIYERVTNKTATTKNDLYSFVENCFEYIDPRHRYKDAETIQRLTRRFLAERKEILLSAILPTDNAK